MQRRVLRKNINYIHYGFQIFESMSCPLGMSREKSQEAQHENPKSASYPVNLDKRNSEFNMVDVDSIRC